MRELLIRSKQIPVEFQGEPKKFKKYFKTKFKSIISSQDVKLGGCSFSAARQRSFTLKQLLAVLQQVKPELKKSNRTGRAKLNIHFDTIITKKPKDIRMGRGKGAPTEKVFVLRGGAPWLNIYGITRSHMRILSNFVLHKITVPATNLLLYKW